jgi:hypothetical protein
MKVQCPGPGCADRRRHWCDPYTPRGPQMVEVESMDHPSFCSTECALFAGVISLHGGLRPREEWKIEWPPVRNA